MLKVRNFDNRSSWYEEISHGKIASNTRKKAYLIPVRYVLPEKGKRASSIDAPWLCGMVVSDAAFFIFMFFYRKDPGGGSG
jgi:hypothetical protein